MSTVFILTGAGISAESGLGTFRDPDGTGIWAAFDPMKLATPEAFEEDPETVHAFYNARRRNLLDARPNPAHAALAALATGLEARGDRLALVTQNIDDLHERAGSAEVVHMHGELLKARCLACGARPSWRQDLGTGDACPVCEAVGDLRPDVVWFGEVPLAMDRILEDLERADLFVAIGTSGSVYPAAGFVQLARSAGIETMEINLDPSDNAHAFDRRLYGPASETVPAFVADVLRRR